LWNAQRTFQYDGMIAKQLMELRALIPAEPDLKLEAGIYLLQNADPEMLKVRYAKIVAAILPPGEDPVVARKKLALLNPKLADQVFPPGSALPPRDDPAATPAHAIHAASRRPGPQCFDVAARVGCGILD
jgi:hypothetical protein